MLILVNEKRKNKGIHRAEEVLEHIPAHWDKYLSKRDGLSELIHCEYIELKEAIDKGTYQEIVHAYTHLAAATLLALDKMVCH